MQKQTPSRARERASSLERCVHSALLRANADLPAANSMCGAQLWHLQATSHFMCLMWLNSCLYCSCDRFTGLLFLLVYDALIPSETTPEQCSNLQWNAVAEVLLIPLVAHLQQVLQEPIPPVSVQSADLCILQE